MLLVQEGDFGWCLPGGGLDHGEEPQQGLRRELQEEVFGLGTLTMQPTPVLVGFSQVERQGFEGQIPVCFIVYRADVFESPEVSPGADTARATFFAAEKILAMKEELAYDERESILHVARTLAD